LPLVNFSANTKATKPTMAPLPLVNSASGLNGPKVLPGAVTPSGLDFFNTGANEAAKMTTAQNGARVRNRIRNAVSQRKRSRGEHLSPQRLVLGDFGVQSSHPADLRDAAVDHLDRGRVREHLHGVVEELRVVPERRGFGDGTIRGVAVL
jgi:hypothetical protein